MAMADIIVTTGKEAEIELFPVGQQGIDLSVSGGASGDPYDGPYSFVPSTERQIINIAQRVSSRNIVVEPIPETWGRIAWNGSALTVS